MEELSSKVYDIIIAGAGLAGLTSAIHLRNLGWSVLCIEKNNFPRHKVCGEYISNEVKPYLISLGFNPKDYGSKDISQFTIYSQNGKSISQGLKMGGFGISRYTIDKGLYDLAIEKGVDFIHEEVMSISAVGKLKEIACKNGTSYKSRTFISAVGKRSKLDKALQRNFISNRTSWMGVKAHYEGEWEEDRVALFQFDGGYCGMSKVENGHVNVCYLVDTNAFKKVGDLYRFEEEVMCMNPSFKQFYSSFERKMERKVISQIFFGDKEKVKDEVAFLGDAAGMIFPLAGNGMAMAIHSAKIYCELLHQYLNNEYTGEKLQSIYTDKWNHQFKKRINNSRRIQELFSRPLLSRIAINILPFFPFVFSRIVEGTHGEDIGIFNETIINETT